ncbi:hypothetical protein TNCV_4036291 [Trichonephila clavipes]|nr:hypothetical protein TNCV_4036291 [Trichonephila clavipes]
MHWLGTVICQLGHLAAKGSYLVYFLQIEELAIVVEHQDKQNQLLLFSSYNIDRPLPFPLQRQPVVSN